MRRYYIIQNLLIIGVLFSGCNGSNEVYNGPIPVIETDSLGFPVDTTPTVQLTDDNGPTRLVIDLSAIENAPGPSDVHVDIKMESGAIVSYSVTTQKRMQKSTESSTEDISVNYVIKKGDTALGLARKFGIKASRIQQPLVTGKKLVIHAD